MKLVLLGTTGYHATDQRQTACLMLPELGVVLDAGTAFYRVREYLRTPTLDVFLTHAHLDHVIGLTHLFDVLFERPLERVTVHAEVDKIAAIETSLLAPLLFPVKLPCEFEVLKGPCPLPQGGMLHWFPLAHPGGVVGFRLDWPGHSLAYVTDTTAAVAADYVRAIRGVDVLVHECYFSDEHHEKAKLTGHSCTTPVAQVARAAKVKRLVLVHMTPLGDQRDPIHLASAQAIFPATQLGHDRLEIEF